MEDKRYSMRVGHLVEAIPMVQLGYQVLGAISSSQR